MNFYRIGLRIGAFIRDFWWVLILVAIAAMVLSALVLGVWVRAEQLWIP
jgi:hypothetical protein